MKKNKKGASELARKEGPEVTLGKYACEVVRSQYQYVIKQEQKVLADQDPEPLHQMRVGLRRLRTALQIFEPALELPPPAQEGRLRSLAKVLGRLRDLDVQTSDLENIYRPQLNTEEQGILDGASRSLHHQRRKAFAAVQEVLGRSRYQKLKTAYETWLDNPQFTPLGQIPLQTILPELLAPLLSTLLLHPGWLIATDDRSPDSSETLHDLRKACKHARYQAEFFTHFYQEEFGAWVAEIKQLQENLGKVQDTQVLRSLLSNQISHNPMPELEGTMHQIRTDALSDWETIRQKYLDAEFRRSLHRMILEPMIAAEPESVEAAGVK